MRFAQPAPAATIVVVRIRVASHCRTSRDFLGAAVTRLKAVGFHQRTLFTTGFESGHGLVEPFVPDTALSVKLLGLGSMGEAD